MNDADLEALEAQYRKAVYPSHVPGANNIVFDSNLIEKGVRKLLDEVRATRLQVEEYRKVLARIAETPCCDDVGHPNDEPICPCVMAEDALDAGAKKPNLEPCGEVFDGEQKCLLPKPCRLHTVKPKSECRSDCRCCADVKPGDVHGCSCHTEKPKCEHLWSGGKMVCSRCGAIEDRYTFEKPNQENAVCMNCLRDDRSCDEHGKPIGQSRTEKRKAEPCNEQYGLAFCKKDKGHSMPHEGVEGPVEIKSVCWGS